MSATYTIYHNPRCSKSRQTLQLLEDAGADINTVLYLQSPPSAGELRALLKKLGIQARDLLRDKEDDYKALKLGNKNLSDDILIDAMASHPKLMERPIVVKGSKAIIGRPPENVNTLL